MDKCDLYGGIARAELPCDSFDMGEGIVVSKTYAHIFSSFMMAFGRAEKGKPSPAPWRAAKGGFSFDILRQIHVPLSFDPVGFFDRLNTIWWFTALLRFRTSPYILLPVIADGPFADGPKDESITFFPVELDPIVLRVQHEWKLQVQEDDLEWIKKNWWPAGKLMDNNEFNLIFQAYAACAFMKKQELALISLWGALEGLFSPSRSEVSFRVSSHIAAFLEPAGKARLELQKKIVKLYNARSQVAHGSQDLPENALSDTYALTKRIISRIIDQNHVPTREDLENALLGGARELSLRGSY